MDTATQPSPCGQGRAHPVAHEDHVSQRKAYSNKAIIGHHSVQETLCAAQEMVEEELGSTALKRDISTLS